MKEIKPGECVIVQTNPLAIMQKGEMTLRDYFAAKAVPALLPHHINMFMDHTLDDYGEVFTGVAADAYQMADAMLKARAK